MHAAILGKRAARNPRLPASTRLPFPLDRIGDYLREEFECFRIDDRFLSILSVVPPAHELSAATGGLVGDPLVRRSASYPSFPDWSIQSTHNCICSWLLLLDRSGATRCSSTCRLSLEAAPQVSRTLITDRQRLFVLPTLKGFFPRCGRFFWFLLDS